MTIGTVLPFRAFRTKPVYAVVSILFHIGLLLTPLLLFDHALLFQNSIGISWLGITLPKHTADLLSVLTVITAFLLLILRISHKTTRAISRKQDYLWLILLMIPFITGLICANAAVSPDTYKTFIIIHMLSGNIIFILLPFTKIAHCVLLPLSQWVTARAWKFVPRAGENVEKILGKEGRKL
jgi:nitrate reductase gamma subunit